MRGYNPSCRLYKKHSKHADMLSVACYQVLQPILSDHDRDAALRLALLKLLDDLMEDPSTAAAVGGVHAQPVLQSLLMPPLIWRAGKVTAHFALCSLSFNSWLISLCQRCSVELGS